ncbi:MAG: ABC transporter ATP-binding protein [Chloroflexi bacterium]|nr:ABC transporter ATP-binding protein [Chloroflexota bacterium]
MVTLAIETEGLSKSYGRKQAAASVSFSVASGTVFGLLGPNGAGKSTTVKMLVGLVRPSSGTAKVFGRPPDHAHARRGLGYVPEQFRFPEWMRAHEFLRFHAELAGVSTTDRQPEVTRVLREVGLEHREHDQLRTFSKGMLQRIGIAQAMVGRPQLVVLDEPTSALDPIGRRDVRDLIVRLRSEGVTVLLNSHLLSEVETVCDHVVIMDRGRIVRAGSMADVTRGHLEVEVRCVGLTSQAVRALEARWTVHRRGVEDGSSEPQTLTISVANECEATDIADILVSGGARLLAMVPRRRTLEDVFVESVTTTDGNAIVRERQ